jgi:hypothetical protein
MLFVPENARGHEFFDVVLSRDVRTAVSILADQ